MPTQVNTGLSLLLIAHLIPTPEGLVWNPSKAISITGPTPTIDESLARDCSGPRGIPVIVPVLAGPDKFRAAYSSAKHKIDKLIDAMNKLDGVT